MSRPVRVLIAKIGLDGHDRGAKLIVRNLRDAGMEVIYTGLWQTPAGTVHAAMQEDVDVLGVSLLSAAHLTVMPEVVRLCQAAGIGDTPVIVGGIIPEHDHDPLREAGVAGVFNPGTPMDHIVQTLRELAEAKRAARLADNGPPELTTPVGLTHAITMISEGRGALLGPTTRPKSGFACVGVTGAPGVGKSTFIGKLAVALRRRGHRVAVVAVDPSSPLTGGSLLGDRLRMMTHEPDEDLFVRSISSSGESGGLGPRAGEIADLLGMAGFPIVLIETVGAGQNDVEIRNITRDVLLLVMPGAGDALQFEKAGVFEIASGFVVNKCDLNGADKTIKDLRDSIDRALPLWPVSSLRGEGLEPLCEWIEERSRAK